MLDGITRLGSLYVQICNSGCTLFQHWKAVFFCNPERPVLTVVEFGKAGKHKVCQNCDVEKQNALLSRYYPLRFVLILLARLPAGQTANVAFTWG